MNSNTNVSSPLSMKLPMDLPMVLPTALPMTLPTALPIALPADLPIVYSLVSGACKTVCSYLASSFVTDATNINLPVSLSPYPDTSLPFHFHCITGIDFAYHPLLYHNHSTWIKTILPILKKSMISCSVIVILIIFVRSTYIFLLFNQ